MQHRVHVIVANLHEMYALIRATGTGLILRKRTPEALAALVRLLDSSAEDYAHWVEACEQAAQHLHWNAEKQKLPPLYGI